MWMAGASVQLIFILRRISSCTRFWNVCGQRHPLSAGLLFRRVPKDSVSVRMAYYNTPVQAVVNQIMKESDNLNAEAMLCRLGAQSAGNKYVSAEDGLSEVRQLIRKLGYVPDHYKLADGCGLSNYNYISSELLVAFLKFAYSRTDVFQKLYKALPIGGVDGTLKNRMKKELPLIRRYMPKRVPLLP